MNISSAGTDLIKRFEQCRLTAYLPTPTDVWTIGWAHTKDVSEGDTITQEAADAFLLGDLRWVEKCLADSVAHALTQPQYDALCSFVYNTGCGAFRGSTMLRLINAGDLAAAGGQFMRWTKQGGKELLGLVRRRAAEAELFNA